MSIPNKATGYGNTQAGQNVFSVSFSTALSAAPVFEAYDGGTFPGTGTDATTLNTVFVGTAGNGNIPMLSLIETTSAAPSGGWMPSAPTAGSANPNRMLGSTSFVTASIVPTAGQRITWNEVIEFPYDCTTAATIAHDIVIRYQYSGAAPVLTWAFNDGGTDAAPSWTTMTPGANGIRHCDAGMVAGGPYTVAVGASTTTSEEGWVTT